MRSLRSSACATAAAVLGLFGHNAVAAPADVAARATNSFGVDLFRLVAKEQGNICLSPYSITNALAMTLAGAAGETRAEMLRVMHLEEQVQLDSSFAALQEALEEMASRTAKEAKEATRYGGDGGDPITLAVANRLFPQQGYTLRPEFLQRVKEFYGAPPEPLDFKGNGPGATKRINDWVAGETRDRIRNLIPQPLPASTRLVLANALYLKAPWAEEFSSGSTKNAAFHFGGGATAEVPMMRAVRRFGYAKRDGFTAVALPYRGGELQFLLLVPDEIGGVGDVEKQLTADVLHELRNPARAEVDLHLPKFKFEPATMALTGELQALGMRSAFDDPFGSANFDRMAPRTADDYLSISDVFHKTFIAVDEKGTEAAAATAVAMRATSAMIEKPKPIVVRADRPFVYAIQHVPSGTCLFIGRMSDPRDAR